MKILLRACLGLFLSFSFLFPGTGCVRAQGPFDHPLVGRPAVDFTLTSLQGESVSLLEQIKGKKAILFFWATWCPHCREQMVAIQTSKEQFSKEGIEVILIDIGEQKDRVERFFSAQRLDYPVLLDVEGSVSEQYLVYGVPSLYYIGADGNVRAVEHGLLRRYSEILK